MPNMGPDPNARQAEYGAPATGSESVFINAGRGLEGENKRKLAEYWQRTITDIEQRDHDFKAHSLPLARIKKVMKADEDVKMISAEAPILFAKGCEIFITELTMRAWIHADENKRRTLQRSDIANAISRSDMFDFLIDIVPREEFVTPKADGTAVASDSHEMPVAGAAGGFVGMPLGHPAMQHPRPIQQQQRPMTTEEQHIQPNYYPPPPPQHQDHAHANGQNRMYPHAPQYDPRYNMPPPPALGQMQGHQPRYGEQYASYSNPYQNMHHEMPQHMQHQFNPILHGGQSHDPYRQHANHQHDPYQPPPPPKNMNGHPPETDL